LKKSQIGNLGLYLYRIARMRIIAKKVLREFWTVHAESEQPLKAWYREAELGNWQNPNELKIDYPSMSILKNGRYVFNIKGNHYRLVVRINFEYQLIFVRFIGTHKEYDKIDATKI